MRTLIRNGIVVEPDCARRADVLIQDEKILAVGRKLVRGRRREAVDQVIRAKGCFVLPGGIDGHTHLDMPILDFASADDFESGTVAAALGGTTTIIDYAERGEKSLSEGLSRWKEKARDRAVIDYGFHMTLKNLNGEVIEEMGQMVSEGVTSFKVFMAYPGRMMLTDDEIRRVMERASELDAVVSVHAEDGPLIEELIAAARKEGRTAPVHHPSTRPASGEGRAAGRAVDLALETGAPLVVVHISAAEAAAEVARGRAEGGRIHGETCPQYLWLERRRLEAEGLAGAAYICSPPLRGPRHMQALWESIQRGEIEMMGTDHCPFNLAGHKDRGFTEDGGFDFTSVPGGLPGIETRQILTFAGGVMSGRLTLVQFAELTAAAPARIFGLWPRKGALAPGFDADVVIVDPGEETSLDQEDLHMRVDYSPYQGMRIGAAVTTVLSRGEVIVDGGEFLGEPGRGRFLKRKPYPSKTAVSQEVEP